MTVTWDSSTSQVGYFGAGSGVMTVAVLGFGLDLDLRVVNALKTLDPVVDCSRAVPPWAGTPARTSAVDCRRHCCVR